MKERYTKPSEAPAATNVGPIVSSSPAKSSELSFFNTALKTQALGQQMIKLNLDPATIMLFTAIFKELQKQNEIALAVYQELKMQNDLALLKMKEAEESKKQQLEAAKVEQAEDNKRFEEIRPMLYT